MGLFAALVVALAAGPTGCGGPKPDENDPWSVVMDYLDALNSSDAGAVADLVSPGYDASADIRSRIDRLGGRALYYQSIQFHGSGMQDLTSADLSLLSGEAGSTATYTDSLALARSDGHWYLVIGRRR